MKYKANCGPCDGSGLVKPIMDKPCRPCGGTGLVDVEHEREVDPLPDNYYAAFVRRLEACDYLDDWQMKFTSSIRDQVIRSGSLSPEQICKADEILKQRE